MEGLRQTDKELIIKIDTSDLNPMQIRMLKTINALLSHVMTSDDESEYFDSSAELMKKVAEAIKHSNFANDNKSIQYGDQAVEFAIDFINEFLDQNKIHNIDN